MAETTRGIASRFGLRAKPASPELHRAWLEGRQAWWEANRTRLVALVYAGLTARAIAAELGVSKGAVMGRVWRTGLTLAHEPMGGRKRMQRAKRRLALSPPPPVKLDPFPPSGGCVYPHGDPGQDGFGFCRARTGSLERPYCEAHARLCYLPPREMRPLPEAKL